MIALLLLLQAQERRVDVAREIVVVVNEAAPGSAALGEYYAARRGIPKTQICRLAAATGETVSWPDCRRTVLDPLREFLKTRPDVLYVVPVWGVPVKTSEEKPENDGGADTYGKFVAGRDYACIDREIELLKKDHELDGWLASATFRADRRITLEDGIYVVSRLDGPGVEAARALVDNAIFGETYGVGGVCLLDTRGLKQDGSYGGIDVEMREIAKVYERFGFEFRHDDAEPVVKLGTHPNQAHYWGWYAGDVQATPDFRFVRGAVGAHLHSFSAGVLRSADKTWTGPLVDRGIAGTCGTVYEPLSVGFPFGTVFLDRFFRGYTFGESMQMANMYTSWMAVFVGDPLYAPYAKGMKEAQAKNRALAKDGTSALAKQVERSDWEGARRTAAELCALPPPYEKELAALLRGLGEALLKQQKYEAALGPLEALLAAAPGDRALALAVARCHLEMKKPERAIAVLETAAVPPAGADEVEAYVQCWELLARAGKEGASKMVSGFAARRAAALPKSRAAAVEKQIDEAQKRKPAPLEDLPAYDEKFVGLPSLVLANRGGWDVEILLAGPMAWSGSFRGVKGTQPKPVVLPLYPGRYRIVLLAKRGKETRAFFREAAFDLNRNYALGVDAELKLYRP
ncbi:MAG: TIGR03790 family protein [Planctomycetes bacterium]|nr:TIGR03790 family protein [Planctomycetota bacterium]